MQLLTLNTLLNYTKVLMLPMCHIGYQCAIFVCVIGLHAVQFGNNWMRKIPRTAKLDEAVGQVQFGSPRNFLNPIISKFDKHVVLLPINYRASEIFVFLFFCSKFV